MSKIKRKIEMFISSWKILLFIMSPFVIFFLVYIYCAGVRSNNVIQYSRSSEKSKENGTFLWKYKVDTMVYYDSLKVNITDAFGERKCEYANYHTNEIKVSYISSKVIAFTDADIQYDLFCIEDEGETRTVDENSPAIAYFESSFPPDTVKFSIFRSSGLKGKYLPVQDIILVRENIRKGNKFITPKDSLIESIMKIR